ncbi:MAG: hypothetical protein R3Y13_00500 [bacterium]
MEVKLDFDEMRQPFHTIGNEQEQFVIKVETSRVISWLCEYCMEDEKSFIITKLDYQLYSIFERFIRESSEGTISYPSEENELLKLQIIDEDSVGVTFYKSIKEKYFKVRMDLSDENQRLNNLFFDLHEKLIYADFNESQISIDEYQYQLKLSKRNKKY